MGAKKTVAMVIDVIAGVIVTLIGFKMVSFPFDMIWGIFNVWLWIVSPTLILWAKNKEDEKNLLSRKL